MRQLGRTLYVGSTLYALAGWKSKVVMGWTLKMMIVAGWTRSSKLVVEVGGMIVFRRWHLFIFNILLYTSI